MLVQAADVGFGQHQTRKLARVADRKGADVIAAESVADQDIRPLDTGVVKRAAELGRDPHTRAGHPARITEACAGAIVAAGACPLRDLWLDDRPHGCPVPPTRIEHNGGRASSRAVEVQPGFLSGYQLTRPRVELITRSGARNALHPDKQANRDCRSECSHGDLHRRPVAQLTGAVGRILRERQQELSSPRSVDGLAPDSWRFRLRDRNGTLR